MIILKWGFRSFVPSVPMYHLTCFSFSGQDDDADDAEEADSKSDSDTEEDKETSHVRFSLIFLIFHSTPIVAAV